MDKILEDEIKKIKNHPGDTIGSGILDDFEFVLKKEREEGLRKLDDAMAEVGCFRQKDIKNFKWYPVGCYLTNLVLAKDIFGWDDNVFREMGANAQKISLITRTMMKYFVSFKKCFEITQDYWGAFFTVGRLEGIEVNEKERHAFVALKDFPGHPYYCRYLEGGFTQVVSYIAKNSGCREIKCSLKGEGEDHLFQVTWEI